MFFLLKFGQLDKEKVIMDAGGSVEAQNKITFWMSGHAVDVTICSPQKSRKILNMSMILKIKWGIFHCCAYFHVPDMYRISWMGSANKHKHMENKWLVIDEASPTFSGEW